jgi:hypothetical protein
VKSRRQPSHGQRRAVRRGTRLGMWISGIERDFFGPARVEALGRSRVELRDWRLSTPSGVTKRVGQVSLAPASIPKP